MAFLILAVTLFPGCIQRPPLRIVVSGETVTIDVQTLGEYQTTAMQIKLIHRMSGKTVWALKAQSGTPQIQTIQLKIGENPAILASSPGTYDVVTPMGSDTFSLEADTVYEISLWGKSKYSKVTGTFRLTNDTYEVN